MGNCQGKKASTDAINTRSLDISKPIPSPVKEERTPSPVPVPVTSPSTPEEDKKQTDETSEPAESVVSENVKEPEVAQAESEVIPLESKTSDAISASTSTSAADIVTSNISEAKSDEKSTVSDVPVFDTKSDVDEPVIKESDSSDNHIPAANSIKEENGTRDLGSTESVGRSLTEPTGVAEPTETKEEVEEVKPAQNTRDLTFMEKMEDTIDSCCGLPPNESEPVGGQEEVQEKEEIPTITSASISLDPSEPNYKSKRKLVKKLRQIEALESKDRSSLTQEQIEKIATKPSILESLASTTD